MIITAKEIKDLALKNYSVEIILDSISSYGIRLITVKLVYPRMIHSELLTHRVKSRNATSSRAIPTKKLIELIINNTAIPLYWGEIKSGMQAGEELDDETIIELYKDWISGRDQAIELALEMSSKGLHKQHVNRPLEPYMLMETLITSTEWDNFFDLRCHPDAQPEIQHLANLIREAIEESVPIERDVHIPFITLEDREKNYDLDTLVKVSTARCARVSYTLRDGTFDVDKDIILHDRLVGSEPLHASPAEHIAWAEGDQFIRNFRGWKQYRVVLEEQLNENIVT